jgi:hypothetical protein
MSMSDDELINRAAHGMTRGEPSSRLREAVRTRIDRGTPGFVVAGPAGRVRHFWEKQARHFWVPALTGAAIVVLAVVAARSLSGPRVELLSSTRIGDVPLVISPVTLQPASPAPIGEQVETSVRAGGPRRTPQRAIVVDPLVIEPISVPLIAVESGAGVMPIEIEPLRIEPLQPQ